ncbi:MAG TPA: hypothetical protein VFL95_09065, partial [Gemmatimonadales bacterium]|nr:hypothetical protein [Gemmatimonadales bacterium]
MLRHLAHRWVWVVALAVIATGEWLRAPAWGWVVAAAVLVLLLLAARHETVSWRMQAARVLLAMLVVVLALAQHRLDRIEHHWPAERESRIEAASRSLQSELHDAFQLVEKLADQTAAAGRLPDRDDAFAALARAVPSSGPEVGLALLDPRGDPWAWSGRHRLRPRMFGDSLDAQSNGYYVLLEARRHSAEGRMAVASVLVWAHPAVPDRGRSLAELFRSRHEVGLVVYPPGAAPSSSDVFDYQVPTTAGPRLLFSLQPLPPEQGSAKQQLLARADRAAVWLTLMLLGVTLVAAARPRERYLMLVLVVWLAVRAPLGQALHLEHLFSKATFFRPELGPLSSSAGILALTATLVTVLGVWLWRRRLARSNWTLLLGAALLAVAPYLVSLLGRGITPPATGVSISLWLTWQLTLVVTVSALIVVTAALFRSAVPERRPRWRIIAGVAIAVAAAVVGIFVWSPRGAWPEWYPFLWTPALLLVTLPAPRWPTIIGIGLVAGSAAALVTWGAELTGRLQVVQRDVARLGAEPDPLALPLLDRFADQVDQAPPPGDVTQLYALWRGSDLGRQNYPADLALWSTAGQKKTQLALDSLDLPDSLLSALVTRLPAEQSRRVVQLVRVPGVHYVVVARLDSATVLTAAIGPRTEAISPSRLGRLLDPARRGSSLYQLSLSPPNGPEPTELHRLRWRREGWNLLAEQTISLPGGFRVVHAVVDLRGPLPLFVRGILVVILDVLVLALLWYLSELVAGARFRKPRWRGLARSFRIRLAVTLAIFFLVPALGFAAWSFARLSDEAQRGRDLLITQTLRDAVVTNQRLLVAPPQQVSSHLEQLSQQIDADLALYRGGEL